MPLLSSASSGGLAAPQFDGPSQQQHANRLLTATEEETDKPPTSYLGMDATNMPVNILVDPVSGYPIIGPQKEGSGATVVRDPQVSVLVNLVVWGVDFRRLPGLRVLDLSDATKEAAATYVGVPESQVVSLPSQSRFHGAVYLEVQMFVPSSQNDALVNKVLSNQGKTFEDKVAKSVDDLNLAAAKVVPTASIKVSLDKIVTNTQTITYDQVVVTYKTTTRAIIQPEPVTEPVPDGVTTTTVAAIPVTTTTVQARVSQVFTMKGLDFAKVSQDVTVMSGLINKVKLGVLENLPAGYTAADLEVVLSAGSVIARVTITPMAGSTSQELSAGLKANKEVLATSVIAQVKQMAKVETLLETGKTLDDLTVTASEPKEVSVTDPTPATVSTTTAFDPFAVFGLVTDLGGRASLGLVTCVLIGFFQAVWQL